MQTNAQNVLNYIVSKANASEENPLKLGNVEFWHEIPGYVAGILCYSIPTSEWDIKAVQSDINAQAEPIWDELVAFLQSREVSV